MIDISPAAGSSCACNSGPSAASSFASENPAAKQTTPPAPLSRKAATTSMVARRFTPTKVASGAPGSAATSRNAGSPSISVRSGCTGQIGPAKPISRHLRITLAHQAPPPTTAMVLGRNRRSRPGFMTGHLCAGRGRMPPAGVFPNKRRRNFYLTFSHQSVSAVQAGAPMTATEEGAPSRRSWRGAPFAFFCSKILAPQA